MRLSRLLLCVELGSCVSSLVIPTKEANDNQGRLALQLSERIHLQLKPINQEAQLQGHQAILATQKSSGFAPSSLNIKHGSLFRHAAINLPCLAGPKPREDCTTFTPTNITTSNAHASLLRVVSLTKTWVTIRESGRRGDTRPLILWIQTSRIIIFRLLRLLEQKGTPGEADSATTRASTLSSIDWQLKYLHEDIESDGRGQISDLTKVVWIRTQILPVLEEMVRALGAE